MTAQPTRAHTQSVLLDTLTWTLPTQTLAFASPAAQLVIETRNACIARCQNPLKFNSAASVRGPPQSCKQPTHFDESLELLTHPVLVTLLAGLGEAQLHVPLRTHPWVLRPSCLATAPCAPVGSSAARLRRCRWRCCSCSPHSCGQRAGRYLGQRTPRQRRRRRRPPCRRRPMWATCGGRRRPAGSATPSLSPRPALRSRCVPPLGAAIFKRAPRDARTAVLRPPQPAEAGRAGSVLKLCLSTYEKKLCIIRGDCPLWQRVLFYHSPVWAVPAPLYRQLAASMHHLLLCCGIKPAQSRCTAQSGCGSAQSSTCSITLKPPECTPGHVLRHRGVSPGVSGCQNQTQPAVESMRPWDRARRC